MCLSFYFFYFIISAFLLSFSVWPLPSTFKELPFVGNFWVILIPRRGTKKKNLSTIHFFTSHMQCWFFFSNVFSFFFFWSTSSLLCPEFPSTLAALSRVCSALGWCCSLQCCAQQGVMALMLSPQCQSQPPCWALITCTSLTELFSSCITSFFWILHLSGSVGHRLPVCRVGHGVFGLVPAWSVLTLLQSPFSWAALAWAFCSLDKVLLWRPWRVRVWVSWGISPSNDKSHNELWCSKIHWSSLSALSKYLANTSWLLHCAL